MPRATAAGREAGAGLARRRVEGYPGHGRRRTMSRMHCHGAAPDGSGEELTSIFGKRAGIVGSAADRCVKGTSYGLGGQEAPQADGQEEAPQTAAQDPRPASSSRQVTRGAVDGACRVDASTHLLRSRAAAGRRCRSRPATRCAVGRSPGCARLVRPEQRLKAAHRGSDTCDKPRPAEASYER